MLKPVQKEFVALLGKLSQVFKADMWLARRRALAKTGPGSCPFSELKSSVGEEDQNLQFVVNTTGDRGSAESPS